MVQLLQGGERQEDEEEGKGRRPKEKAGEQPKKEEKEKQKERARRWGQALGNQRNRSRISFIRLWVRVSSTSDQLKDPLVVFLQGGLFCIKTLCHRLGVSAGDRSAEGRSTGMAIWITGVEWSIPSDTVLEIGPPDRGGQGREDRSCSGNAAWRPRGEIDARGRLWPARAMIDMHVHLREPGQEHKETIATGREGCGRAAGSLRSHACPTQTPSMTVLPCDTLHPGACAVGRSRAGLPGRGHHAGAGGRIADRFQGASRVGRRRRIGRRQTGAGSGPDAKAMESVHREQGLAVISHCEELCALSRRGDARGGGFCTPGAPRDPR